MDSLKDSVAFWTSVVGTVTGVLGLFQSQGWVAAIGALLAVSSLSLLLYAERERSLVRSATIRIDDLSIDSLNLATLRRRLNRSLSIQRAENLASIDGEDIAVIWRCSGYCNSERESAIEFSIDADANIPFDRLDCVGFDLKNDPQRRHPITPILMGPDGMSKKVAIPFLALIDHQEAFSVELRYRLPHCVSAGTDYYTATLSFEQDSIRDFSVQLRFRHGPPQWVRVYECQLAGNVGLLKDLRPRRIEAGMREYVDVSQDVPGQYARIYVFSRPSLAGDRMPTEKEGAVKTAERRSELVDSWS